MFDAFKTIAIVPARDGSKGYPGKNFKNFNEKPLFLHAIDQALRTCDCCIFSSDNEDALQKAKFTGCIAHKRIASLARDDAPMDITLLNIIDIITLRQNINILQPTSPLRLDTSIKKAIDTFEEKSFDLVMGVSSANSSILKSGFVSGNKFKPVGLAEHCFSNRQALPKIYKPNGSIFVCNSSWLSLNGSLATPKIGCIKMSENESYDIDTYEDFLNC